MHVQRIDAAIGAGEHQYPAHRSGGFAFVRGGKLAPRGGLDHETLIGGARNLRARAVDESIRIRVVRDLARVRRCQFGALDQERETLVAGIVDRGPGRGVGKLGARGGGQSRGLGVGGRRRKGAQRQAAR